MNDQRSLYDQLCTLKKMAIEHKIAFESDIHETGCTMRTFEIDEFETILEKDVAGSF